MTSQSEQQKIAAQVSLQLEQDNAHMPDEVKHDITRARIQAIAKAKQAKSTSALRRTPWPTAIVSVGMALAVVALVSYQPNSAIPVLPTELLTEDVPPEDLALLEDLDFANWLLEQEEAVL